MRYDYHLYAFVHPDAIDAKPILERLGYLVQVREAPINITEIANPRLIDAQSNGCCNEKEWLKLYSYLLLDYPVVVHLDLDTLVLRPMDDLFDFMTLSQDTAAPEISYDQVQSFARTSTMWMNKIVDERLTHSYKDILEEPEQINFMFTRDYNMVDPPRKKPYQIGVQGGFLVIRPNLRDFNRMVEIILSGGNFTINHGWGGQSLGYGGYYGAGTIQGLASYYYDYHEKGKRSIELNRCKYNTMVDDPYDEKKDTNETLCRTLEETCEDCRESKLEDVYTTHFTVCGKPEYCVDFDPVKERLCFQLMREWHKARSSLELDWMKRFSSNDTKSGLMYEPQVGTGVDVTVSASGAMGHCNGPIYVPLLFPPEKQTKLWI